MDESIGEQPGKYFFLSVFENFISYTIHALSIHYPYIIYGVSQYQSYLFLG
ncbi:MAG: hypothetical protein WBF83_01080 [Moheibacter sp.]